MEIGDGAISRIYLGNIDGKRVAVKGIEELYTLYNLHLFWLRNMSHRLICNMKILLNYWEFVLQLDNKFWNIVRKGLDNRCSIH